MLEKIILSDQEFEYLTKGIAFGVGIGSLIYSHYKKATNK